MEKTVEIYKDEPRVGTFMIAEGFDRKHKAVTNLINIYKDRFIRLDNKDVSKGLIARKVPAKKAGRPVEEYLLNEKQTIFLGTLFRNTEKVLDFKEKLAEAFVEQRKQLDALKKYKLRPEYQQIREAGKIIRRGATDVMQEFCEYAKKQGSEHADKYYSNITRMLNGLMFIVQGKFKNVREVMTTQQLMTVGSAEEIIKKGLEEGMKYDTHYKAIYQDIKKRVELFAELHGRSEIISKYMELEE